MAEWYIRGSSSSHQLITLDSDSFPPLLARFYFSPSSLECGRRRSNGNRSISSLARAAAVAFALFGAGLLYYEHLNRFIMVAMLMMMIVLMLMMPTPMMMSTIYISVGYAEQPDRRPSLGDW